MTTPIPIAFFGSDQYSATVMKLLIDSPEINITNLVATNMPNPQTPKSDPPWADLHQLAKTHNIPITPYPQIHDSKYIIHNTANTLGVLASFGHILPPSILNLFPSGILCLHPSLLPQYRNTSPVPYAIALGDQVTGITLFRIDNTIDNGKILSQQEESILPTDTSPILLHRLFKKGTQLAIDHLTQTIPDRKSFYDPGSSITPLIFTQKLTTESGHLKWNVVKKLINNQSITASDTNNKLLKLRLTRPPLPTAYCTLLTDLIRALDGWEKVWTILPAQAGAKTKKGDLRISISLNIIHDSKYMIHISGKPNPISWDDFTTYYL